MSSTTETVFGYILVCIGLVCILFAFYSAYKVFTNAANPPEVFQMRSLDIAVSPPGADAQPTRMTISLDAELRKTVNVFLYYLFMMFIVVVGSNIASLGVKFIKEITVKVPSQ